MWPASAYPLSSTVRARTTRTIVLSRLLTTFVDVAASGTWGPTTQRTTRHLAMALKLSRRLRPAVVSSGGLSGVGRQLHSEAKNGGMLYTRETPSGARVMVAAETQLSSHRPGNGGLRIMDCTLSIFAACCSDSNSLGLSTQDVLCRRCHPGSR